jgi:hypothetical protein
MLRLTIHNPIPGFLYKIRWVPKDQDVEQQNASAPAVTLQNEVRAARVQADLLKMARAAAGGAGDDKTKYDSIAAPLRALAGDIAKIRNLRETLDVSVMVFRTEDARLYTICANYGSIAELLKETFATGEGCAGFVFEKIRPILYHSSRETIGYFISPDELPGGGAGLLKPAVLLCFPWVEAGIVLGVVNVSTQKEDSDLLGLFDLPKEESQRAIEPIQQLVRQAAKNLYTMVAEGTYATHLGPEGK